MSAFFWAAHTRFSGSQLPRFFLVAGIIGAYSYWKLKFMDLKLALYLSIGSLPGAFLGVQINVLISETLAKLLLYLFVLFAGLSIILKKNKAPADNETETDQSVILKKSLYGLWFSGCLPQLSVL